MLEPNCPEEDVKVGSATEFEKAKAILRLFPIWSTCLVYAKVLVQSSTFFTKQGMTMDRSVWSGFDITAASLQVCISLSIVLFVPIYDRIFIPMARKFTNKPSGITMLQRIGIGIFISSISMVIAALVETKRLKTTQDHGLIDMPYATVPMRVWLLVPLDFPRCSPWLGFKSSSMIKSQLNQGVLASPYTSVSLV